MKQVLWRQEDRKIYVPGFVEEKADLLGPVLGMKINMLLKFPQAGFKKEDVADICAKLDALDA